MAGRLTLIKKEVITTATSSITMTGINTNDEHWLVINNLRTDGGTEARLRLTVSGNQNIIGNLFLFLITSFRYPFFEA